LADCYIICFPINKANLKDLTAALDFQKEFVDKYSVTDSIQQVWTDIKKTNIIKMIDNHVPTKMSTKRFNQPWITTEVTCVVTSFAIDKVPESLGVSIFLLPMLLFMYSVYAFLHVFFDISLVFLALDNTTPLNAGNQNS
jgi:hypothetical protein